MKDYTAYVVNNFVRAQLLSGRPYQSYYLELNLHEQGGQTEYFLDRSLTRRGWMRSVVEAGPVNGWKIVWYTKAGSGGDDQWNDTERGENLGEVLDILHSLNIGPVPMRYLG